MISDCGDCYGAASSTTPCCNTCNEVTQAYEEKRWRYNVKDFKQCEEKEGIYCYRVCETRCPPNGMKKWCTWIP